MGEDAGQDQALLLAVQRPIQIPLGPETWLRQLKKKCRPSGRNEGKNTSRFGLSLSRITLPPAAGTRLMTEPWVMTMSPSRFQVPPRALGASAIVSGVPPRRALFSAFHR
jgi:hypothetical protein